MKFSTSFFPTQREVPVDAVIPSHVLMIRAGLIKPLGAGIYCALPMGYKVVRKVMEIVREEMNKIGGQEFYLPALNPVDLWEETGRVKDFGDILFQIKNRALVLAPTHEEVICHIAKFHLKSYKDLPQIWYQIQTKFRNEPRPRSGVLRGRQFIMKDSYSMDATPEGLNKSYEMHAEAYKKIFTRCGLNFFIVGASSGAMGGSGSQEFMVESKFGEDTCAVCSNCDYAANLEVAVSKIKPIPRKDGNTPVKEIHTPNVRTIDELVDFLNIKPDGLAKSLVFVREGEAVMVLMSGNDQLNETKLIAAIGGDIRPMHPEEIFQYTGANAGSLGPVNLNNFTIIADKRLKDTNGLVSGANRDDYHLENIDLNRDVKINGYYDLRSVTEGEECAECGGNLRIVNAIEIGHIFKLGTRYSKSMNAYFLDDHGKQHPIIMGSYGIGIERIVASHIEQNHDEKGIIWEEPIAPYQIHIIALNVRKEGVKKNADKIYSELLQQGFKVVYDDRDDVTAGVKFNDADLIGIPLQIIAGEKNLKEGKVEIKIRKSGERIVVEINKIEDTLRNLLR